MLALLSHRVAECFPKDTYSKAAKAELAKSYDSAFKFYIKAAELFLHIARSSDNEKDKAKIKGSAAKALERAEKIKAFTEKNKAGPSSGNATNGGLEMNLTPVGVNYFSARELPQSFVKPIC